MNHIERKGRFYFWLMVAFSFGLIVSGLLGVLNG